MEDLTCPTEAENNPFIRQEPPPHVHLDEGIRIEVCVLDNGCVWSWKVFVTGKSLTWIGFSFSG